MISFRIGKIISLVLLVSIIFVQFFSIFSEIGKPQKAQAVLGVADVGFDFSTKISDPAQIAIDIGKAAAARIASNYANQFIERFVDKMLDKYKIKNYLYYSKLLSSYYLNQYIADKIGDPDLRNAFEAASSLYQANAQVRVGNVAVGDNSQLKIALQKLKEAQSKYYLSRGGIDPNNVYNPSPDISDVEYFNLTRAYLANPPLYTREDVNAQVAQIQVDAERAAQQEIQAGSGYKASRTLSGCSPTPSCTNIQSIISNPASALKSYVDGAINNLLSLNLDPKNPYSAIGDALGSFIFKKLQLNSSDGQILDEYGDNYVGDNGSFSSIRDYEIDLDSDGIVDGRDVDQDGQLASANDICYHGGIASVDPGCYQSTHVGTSPYFTPLCTGIDRAKKEALAYIEFQRANINLIIGGLSGEDFVNDADAEVWGNRTNAVLSAVNNLLDSVRNFHNPNFDQFEIQISRYANFLSALTTSLYVDQDVDLDDQWDKYDTLGDMISFSQDIADYMAQIRAAIGKCENPNTEAVAAVPPPDNNPSAVNQTDIADALDQVLANNPNLSNTLCSDANLSDKVTQLQQLLKNQIIANNSDASVEIKPNDIEFIYVSYPPDYQVISFRIFDPTKCNATSGGTLGQSMQNTTEPTPTPPPPTPTPTPAPTPTPPSNGVTVLFSHYPVGTIFKYPSDPTVYIKDTSTSARPITDWSVYLNQVPGTRYIITIPQYVNFTRGTNLGLRSGTLIKSSDNPTVYLMVGTEKRPFSSEQEFFGYNYGFTNVYVINDPPLVNSIPTTTAEFVRPVGTLFKYASSPAVYFLNTARQKRGYTTLQMFQIWNATLKDVITIPDSETYPDGPVATFPGGILVKGTSSSTIYWVYDGVLRPFPPNDLFYAMGLSLNIVYTFSNADIALHPIGTPMQ